ncbi:MAG TPA: AraC family transcriptional regulator [Cryomorphaceae bacterium]|nr:AraC family transcriptional regulator [Owenweeksia sp.]HBF18619.1 AraC family transcriptional regulator [Cryomorphaceae bacterium]HCQ16714.1 AraC family transcriptional regulator [Cryomorphaceae bacterium]|tara:strand:- start:4459 stop:5397 length:939 start_codon:yes stop_codon:yes gene_type:complete
MSLSHITSLEEFYKDAEKFSGKSVEELLPPGITRDVGHFNVFDLADTIQKVRRNNQMPYNRRAYYKISLIRGRNRAEYADKVVQVEKNALLFGTPRVPYHWIPQDENQSGSFCVFSPEFMLKNKSGVVLDDLPIFQAGGYPIFEISDEQAEELSLIYRKMEREIASDYEFKYDLLRTYVLELVHQGQKLQPASTLRSEQNAGARIVSFFIELLERQFPIESAGQRLKLRSAKEYAERLSVHVNHLNKVLKEGTGKTTTELISSRILQEAKILLKQTTWTVSEISDSLGFEEVAHFSNFFKKRTDITPLKFRS